MKPNRSFWPYGIILTFVLFIGGTVSLIVFASSQQVDLVSPNYYEQELKYQQRIDGLDRAKQLGNRASVSYDATSQRLTVCVPAEQVREKLAGQIQLYRPSAAGLDRELKLSPDANGIQTIDSANLERGLWKVRVSWNAGGQDYFVDQKIIIGRPTQSEPKL